MSALGHKRTSPVPSGMSALGLKADIRASIAAPNCLRFGDGKNPTAVNVGCGATRRPEVTMPYKPGSRQGPGFDRVLRVRASARRPRTQAVMPRGHADNCGRSAAGGMKRAGAYRAGIGEAANPARNSNLRLADGMSALPPKDAMRAKDAASSSFDCFNIDRKERDAMTRSAAVTAGEHTLYAALELSKNSWLLAIQVPGRCAPRPRRTASRHSAERSARERAWRTPRGGGRSWPKADRRQPRAASRCRCRWPPRRPSLFSTAYASLADGIRGPTATGAKMLAIAPSPPVP